MDRYIPRPVNRANLYCCAILISCRYHLYRLSRPPSRSLTPNGHAPSGRDRISEDRYRYCPSGGSASGASALPKIMSLTSFATLFSGSALTRIFHETPAASADTAESAPESAKFNPRRTASTTPVEFCVFPRIFSGLHTLATKFHEISGLTEKERVRERELGGDEDQPGRYGGAYSAQGSLLGGVSIGRGFYGEAR